MTRKEQLKSCELCTNRTMSMKQGLLCALTNAKAAFEDKCTDFKEDAQAVRNKEMIQQAEAEEHRAMKMAIGFAIIGWISMFNVSISPLGVGYFFGFGVTQVITAISDSWGLLISAAISLVYVITYEICKHKEYEWAYRLMYYLYLVDTLIYVAVFMWAMKNMNVSIPMFSVIFSLVFHIGMLVALYVFHPFYSTAIRKKSRTEKWGVLRVITTIIFAVLIISTLYLGVYMVSFYA